MEFMILLQTNNICFKTFVSKNYPFCNVTIIESIFAQILLLAAYKIDLEWTKNLWIGQQYGEIWFNESCLLSSIFAQTHVKNRIGFYNIFIFRCRCLARIPLFFELRKITLTERSMIIPVFKSLKNWKKTKPSRFKEAKHNWYFFLGDKLNDV